MKENLLKYVASGNLSPKQAYKKIYKQRHHRLKRAYFFKLSLKIYEHPKVSFFISLLFLLPWPIGLIGLATKMSSKKMTKEDKDTLKTALKMIKYKPLYVQVNNEEIRLNIRTI